ncbi:MAG: TIGR02186 family protein [Pseudomonadota bacterium]
MKNFFTVCLLILLSIVGRQVENALAADPILDLDPAVVEIGTFYNGTTVQVSGMIPAGAEAVVRLSGEPEELHLKRKGKVGGVLWMNTGDLTFDNAPRVYKLFTANGLDDLDHSGAKDFGFAALKNRIKISPASEDNDFLLKEFIRLKEHESLYAMTPGSVKYGTQENGMKSFDATMLIPPGMKPGSYNVEVAAVSNGAIIGTAAKPLVLELVSLPSQLSNMAFGHALWYGIMSVVIAVMAGLVMGTLFRGKGGGAH